LFAGKNIIHYSFFTPYTLPTFTILFLFTITFARQTYLTASIP
jgi:hypothetical protein